MLQFKAFLIGGGNQHVAQGISDENGWLSSEVTGAQTVSDLLLVLCVAVLWGCWIGLIHVHAGLLAPCHAASWSCQHVPDSVIRNRSHKPKTVRNCMKEILFESPFSRRRLLDHCASCVQFN